MGTDPLDTDFELAHLKGVIIRKLIDGQVFTTNPFYLFLMTFLAIICLFPLIITIIEALSGNPFIFVAIFYLPHELVGVGLIRNVIKSILFVLNHDMEDHWLDIIL